MTPEMPRKQQYNPSNDNKDNQEGDSGLGFDSEQNTNLRQTVNDSGSGQIAGAAFFRSPEPRMNLVDCTPPSHQQVIRKAYNAFGHGEESTSSYDSFSGARRNYAQKREGVF